MEGLNIWQCICKFFDIKTIIKFRLLSKGHAQLGHNLVKQRVFVLDHTNIGQLISWVYKNTTMVSMENICLTIGHDDDDDGNVEGAYRKTEQEPVEYEETSKHWSYLDFCNLRSAYKYIINIVSNDLEGSDGEDEDRCIPNEMSLETIFYLKYPLMIRNTRGINTDVRGTKHAKIEFGDFYDVWNWEQGFLTLKDIIDGCFRLKSHKFENWYEMVTRIQGVKIMKAISEMPNFFHIDMIYYSATLYVDHGS